MRKVHPQVEYSVDDASGKERIFKTFDEAAGFSVAIALTGRLSNIDVLIYSESGAKFYGGDEAVEVYEADPEASVHERIEITANMLGRIP